MGLVEAELVGQVATAVLVEVPVVLKLLAQSCQLLGAEGGAGPLLVGGAVGGSLLLLDLSGSGS